MLFLADESNFFSAENGRKGICYDLYFTHFKEKFTNPKITFNAQNKRKSLQTQSSNIQSMLIFVDENSDFKVTLIVAIT